MQLHCTVVSAFVAIGKADTRLPLIDLVPIELPCRIAREGEQCA
jgi:hypothetical protein